LKQLSGKKRRKESYATKKYETQDRRKKNQIERYSKGKAACECAPYRTVKMTLERADFIFGHDFST
jgi:hypothetical protein